MIRSSTSLDALAQLVKSLKHSWRTGTEPDAVAAVQNHPDLLLHRSFVIDLAYEEYCLREEAGSTPETEEFCHRFPAFQSHIRKVLRGHLLLANHPELLERSIKWPTPGDCFNQLAVLRELGRGAFARVYLARDLEAGDRLVVLKLTPSRSVEARTLGPISHSSIIPILWAREWEGLFAVCMPLVSFATLRDAIESAFQTSPNLPSVRHFLDAVLVPELPSVTSGFISGRELYPDAIAMIALRVAGAVEYLHNANIVHGDIKPSNILLDPSGHPYLIDFNLSTTLTDSPLRCGGTLPYMPPERLRMMLDGEAESTSRMTGDVYSFGVVLYEALVGRVPFEPISANDSHYVATELLQRMTARTEPLIKTHRSVPRPLTTIIERCLDPNPHNRPTIQQVKCELERYRTRNRRRTLQMVCVALLLLVGAGVWLLTGIAHPDPDLSAQTPEQIQKSTTNPYTATGHFTQGIKHLKADRIPAALKEFNDANRIQPNGLNTAYLAYCLSLSGQTRPAIDLYSRAIQQHHFAPAWVLNNLAHALLQTVPSTQKLQEAEDLSTAALELSPHMRSARLNRTYARFRLKLAKQNATELSTEALADIELVMKEPPHTADLYSKAAAMMVAFGHEREDSYARAVGYLEEAIKLGRSPQAIGADPLLRVLHGRADFQRLLGLTPGKPVSKPINPYLAPPPFN